MPKKSVKSQEQLIAENAALRTRLAEAEETLRAIRSGEVDALMISGVGGEQLYMLKGADHLYRVLIEEMNEGALTLTAEGVILYANRGFSEMLKAPLEKVIGSTIHTWIAPDSQPILQSLLRKGLDQKRHEQLVLTASDGTRVPVSLSASQLLIKETPASFCLVATDLTEQIRSDAIVASEKLARELLAASSQTRLELLSVIADKKTAEQALCTLTEELEQKVAQRTSDLRDSQLALLSIVEDLNDSNKNIAVVNQSLDATNKELEAFSYSVSHDLRAPLRSVDAYARMIEEDYAERLDDEGRRLLKVIRDSAHDMGQLISDLLAFSRLSRKGLHMGRIGMKELVTAALRKIEQAENGRAIRWEIGELPSAFGDEALIREALINLLANAVKYTRPRQVATIGISGCVDGDNVVYCVTDNGVGFDMAYKDKLFCVFQRLHTTAEFEGTGIGLALVQRIIQRHGGQVWAEGKVNEGATFYFSLPGKVNAE